MARNILVVEDDNNISNLIKMYLDKEGFDVRIAADGGKAVEEFKEKEPDLVLLDVMLPVLDGWGVCAKIRETSKCPIIMLTAKGEVNDRIHGLEMGADDYVVKPFEMKELLARINAVLRRSEIPEDTHFVVGVPIVSEGATVGFVLAVTGARALTTMWRTFIGLFFMTAVTVLLLSFVVSAWVSMRQSRPIHEMAEATRRFAEGNFDVRMHNYEGVTEITELAESFNNMADSLQETERQRREFIANVSHELKTPMTTIAGYTDGILDGTIPPEQEKEYLRIISDEARRLSRLVRRMLEVSQLQSRDLTRTKAPFDVCESMRRVLISMEKKITDRGLDVDADIPDSGIMVLGDNDLITQVIYNLLENATKFARKGSALYLGVTTLNGKALISVRNEGDTIPAEEIPLLFERFHKSDKSRSEDKDGVGLGLYVVKTILDQHKEHIAVTSENGLTTFTFSVTLAGGQTAQ